MDINRYSVWDGNSRVTIMNRKNLVLVFQAGLFPVLYRNVLRKEDERASFVALLASWPRDNVIPSLAGSINNFPDFKVSEDNKAKLLKKIECLPQAADIAQTFTKYPENSDAGKEMRAAAWIFFLFCDAANVSPVNYVEILEQELRIIINSQDPFKKKGGVAVDHDLELPYYFGAADDKSPMEIVPIRFERSADAEPHRVRITDTVMERYVGDDDVLYAVRKGGKYVRFLPRCLMHYNIPMTVSDSGIKIGNEVYKSNGKIACWVNAGSSGFPVIHSDHTTGYIGAKLSEMPEKAISVSACADDPVWLLPSGKCEDIATDRPLLSAEVGLNNIIGVTSDRRAVLMSGEVLPRSGIVAAYVYEEHWILLDADGAVYTDSVACDKIKAYDVGICSDGYYILTTDERLMRCPFEKDADWEAIIKAPDFTREFSVDDGIGGTYCIFGGPNSGNSAIKIH